jgi:hypothetical protein
MTNAPRPSWIREHLNGAQRTVIRDCILAAAGVALITVTACSMGNAAPVTCDQRSCSDWKGVVQHSGQLPEQHNSRPRRGSFFAGAVDANGNAVIVGRRPEGCPRAHCGCSTSLYIFGKIKPHLNLAANWMKFPRTSPASGMVAARRGHVMVLISQVEGNDWLTWDPNSGGGLTRQHVRSLRGYRVVNPHGAYAQR